LPDAKEYKFDAGLIIPFDGEVMLGAAGRRYLDDQIRVGVRNVPVKKYDRTVKRMSAEELGGKLQFIRFAKGTLASDGEKSILYFDGSGCMWNVRKGSWERKF